eukprot:scaffold953_cov430-Prasinococcus_capsulatus_cf.AAC.1
MEPRVWRREEIVVIDVGPVPGRMRPSLVPVPLVLLLPYMLLVRPVAPGRAGRVLFCHGAAINAVTLGLQVPTSGLHEVVHSAGRQLHTWSRPEPGSAS